MVRLNEIRENEVAIEQRSQVDAGLVYIGRISTPWLSRLECPRQGRLVGLTCEIEIFEPWTAALDGVEALERIEVLYWLRHFRRDLVKQSPANDGAARGTFALRSPSSHPIGTSIVKFVSREDNRLLVRGLDCLDGTPLLDLKPDRTLFTPIAPPQKGDFQVGD